MLFCFWYLIVLSENTQQIAWSKHACICVFLCRSDMQCQKHFKNKSGFVQHKCTRATRCTPTERSCFAFVYLCGRKFRRSQNLSRQKSLCSWLTLFLLLLRRVTSIGKRVWSTSRCFCVSICLSVYLYAALPRWLFVFCQFFFLPFLLPRSLSICVCVCDSHTDALQHSAHLRCLYYAYPFYLCTCQIVSAYSEADRLIWFSTTSLAYVCECAQTSKCMQDMCVCVC